ncbi:hypothetical protein Taro_025081 [Colocasia esculenta]|uniref:BZIP domain-containing protein n=1 Tax=Colocasia esculenta TaxID=4460 RepID=A0A843V993_COLES|nr:hypothetical protein [Colocasia esculenta]
MGNGEIATSSKAEKASSSVLERTSVHLYPDWAAVQLIELISSLVIQAYYGTGVTMAPPYFNTAVTPGHAPHPYMWGPQFWPHDYSGHLQSLMQETTAKSPRNKDSGTLKKRKGPDGLAVSVCNGSDEKEAQSVAVAPSPSIESETKGSSSGSDKNNMETNERELKRERRKQSNRESARRSRLRKQAETEELAQKVECLRSENLVLKSEISRLSEDSAKLRQENSALTDKLKNAEPSHKEDPSDDKMFTSESPLLEREYLLTVRQARVE